jgi:cytochrome b involved in lipid metabolism
MNETSKAAGAAGAAPATKAAKKKTGGGGGGLTMEEVAKHNKKGDCWVVLGGKVLNVSKFLPDHPGGELAILTFAGKDATEEFNMIHPPDVVGKYAPDAVIGELGAGGAGGDDDSESEEEEADAGDGFSLAEIAKHNTKTDVWVAINGMCLNVTKFLPEHPGGELAILTFVGKDASEEFNMIHPPGVIEKYAPDAIIGKVGTGAAKKKSAKSKKSAPTPAARTDKGDKIANIHSWGSGRYESLDDGSFTHPTAYVGAAWYLLIAVLWEICATIFSAKNVKTGNDRVGLTRSAILLILFIVIHAVGNLHVFLGPDDFNGYGYFYVRLYWTGFGLPANIVEEYILLSVALHVFVGLKRTWEIKLRAQPAGKPRRGIGETIKLLNLALSGLMLLCFMTIHLFQFRFGNTSLYYLRPPTYLINFWGILSLNLFWTADETVTPVGVRDIYKLEYDVFKSSVEDGGQPTFWFYFYIFSVCVFVTHACLGWANVIGVLGVPAQHKTVVRKIGYGIFLVMGLIYISFPLYVAFTDAFAGHEVALQH